MAVKTKKTIKKAQSSHSPHSHRENRHTDWQEDHGIGYATYDDEENYVSPVELDDERIDNLRNFNQRLATSPIFIDDRV